MSDQKRGFIKSTALSLFNVARGALGGEFLTAGRFLASNAKDTMAVKTCPRCFERSMYKVENQRFVCTRSDICGWSGDAAQARDLEEQEHNISPAVYAIAKGVEVDFDKAYVTSRFFSWLLWGIVLLMLLYSVYLSAFSSAWIFGWALGVALLFSLHAVRYAYRAQFLAGVFREKPMLFLLYPRYWFVV